MKIENCKSWRCFRWNIKHDRRSWACLHCKGAKSSKSDKNINKKRKSIKITNNIKNMNKKRRRKWLIDRRQNWSPQHSVGVVGSVSSSQPISLYGLPIRSWGHIGLISSRQESEAITDGDTSISWSRFDLMISIRPMISICDRRLLHIDGCRGAFTRGSRFLRWTQRLSAISLHGSNRDWVAEYWIPLLTGAPRIWVFVWRIHWSRRPAWFALGRQESIMSKHRSVRNSTRSRGCS